MGKMVSVSVEVHLARLQRYVDAVVLAGMVEPPSMQKVARNRVRAVRMFAESGADRQAQTTLRRLTSLMDTFDLDHDVSVGFKQRSDSLMQALQRHS